jgi:hypothetical protein
MAPQIVGSTTLGNAPVDNIHGLGRNNVDMTFSKNARIGERKNVQLRWELYKYFEPSVVLSVEYNGTIQRCDRGAVERRVWAINQHADATCYATRSAVYFLAVPSIARRRDFAKASHRIHERRASAAGDADLDSAVEHGDQRAFADRLQLPHYTEANEGAPVRTDEA